MQNVVLEFLGHPLLKGDELMATSEKDLFLRWKPRMHAYFMRMAHPFHGQDPEETARAEFGGYPPVAAADGAVIADDKTNRFMALIQGFPSTRWHRDTGSSLGIPASDTATVFTGIGGPGATYGVTAIDALTGLSRWTFAPEGLPRDGQVSRKLTMLRYVRTIVPRGNGRVDTRTSEGLKAALLQALENGFDQDLSSRRINVSQPYSLQPHGHWTNGGLVQTGGKMYAEVNGSIAALDSRTGSPAWRKPLPEGMWVRSMVATDKHLVMCLSNGSRRPLWDRRVLSGEQNVLAAWQLQDGKEVWSERVARPGSLALADGLVYFANGDLRVLGPAERTYRLAADSDTARDYYRPAADLGMPLVSDCGPDPHAERVPGPVSGPGPEVRGDASVLRVAADMDPGELLRKARERRRAAQGVPLLVQLDWLDARRENPRGGTGPRVTRERVEALLSLCARLAEEVEPEYFDVAPEVNIYLRRYPDQARVLQDLIQRARNTVQQVAPSCRVLVSLNAEVALDLYGRMLHKPYGDLPRTSPETAQVLASLLTLVDTIGISSQPQAAFPTAEQMPPDYLLRLKVALPRKPLVLTRLVIQADKGDFLSRATQAGFGERLLEAAYWMNARLVAQPEWIGHTRPPRNPEGKTPVDVVQLAMERWRGAVRFERRDQLTAIPPPAADGVDGALDAPAPR